MFFRVLSFEILRRIRLFDGSVSRIWKKDSVGRMGVFLGRRCFFRNCCAVAVGGRWGEYKRYVVIVAYAVVIILLLLFTNNSLYLCIQFVAVECLSFLMTVGVGCHLEHGVKFCVFNLHSSWIDTVRGITVDIHLEFSVPLDWLLVLFFWN
jgi:hypothetical protein